MDNYGVDRNQIVVYSYFVSEFIKSDVSSSLVREVK